MTAHDHAELIKAKVDNMDLVAFCKIKSKEAWVKLQTKELPAFKEYNEYFLCLPQHNKNGQCLHWLNGGDIEFTHKGSSYWMNSNKNGKKIAWSPLSDFMSDEFEYRIKSRKENRWIAIGEHGGAYAKLFATKHEAEFAHSKSSGCQFAKIKIKV